METERFDALATRLAGRLTRRHGLGLLTALGAATLGADAAAGKHKHKKKKKKKPCGGTCGACQACVNGACAQLAEGTACGSNGACFRGECATCPSGKTSVDGLCATACVVQGDCAAGSCVKMANHSDANVNDTRRFCVVTDGQGGITMPPCPNGRSSDCTSGNLCVDYATAIRCAPPA